MQKRILLAMLLCTVLAQAATLEKTYTFKMPQIITTDGQHRLQMDNTRLDGIPGEPMLPYRAVQLCLPAGMTLDYIEVVHNNIHEINGALKLMPMQPNRPLSDSQSTGRLYKNTAVYASKASYPVINHSAARVHYLHGAAFVLTTITPVQYIPATGRVSYSENITVKVHTKPRMLEKAFAPSLPASPAVFNQIQRFAHNPEVLRSYPRATADTDDYPLLIITANGFESRFDTLVAFYKNRGIKSQVVTLETLSTTAQGADDAEKMRNYIRQAVADHGVEFVLLGGDVDVLPYRGLFATAQDGNGNPYPDSPRTPADLYFSALDGNWNTDGDDAWGEPENAGNGQVAEDDLLPEVSVGRLPFSTPDELNNMIQKTIAFQDQPVTGELDAVLLAGEKMWDNPLTWSATYQELLIGESSANGYTTSGIPEDQEIRKLYEKNEAWGPADLIASLNLGGTAVYHSGHSNYTYNMQFSDAQITDANFALLNGVEHNYIMVNTQGCNAGGFDVADCIAECMLSLENMAFAFVGASRSGWFNEGQSEGPSIHLAREFVSALYGQREAHIGTCHLLSKLATAAWVNPLTRPDGKTEHEPGAQRWTFYALNVLGDPALALWTDEPKIPSIHMPQPIKDDATAFALTLNVDGQPAAGYFCALLQNDAIVAYTRTDVNGAASIDLTAVTLTLGDVQLIVSGNNIRTVRQDLQVTAVREVSAQPRTPALIGNYPNPFNPETTLKLSLPTALQAKIEIFDVTGRWIRTLCNEKREAGLQTLRWDGRDAQGAAVASGLYLVRLSTARGNDVHKISLLR